MKRFILMSLSVLLLLGTLTGCAAKNTDVYYGDVKLERVEEAYEPEKIRLDNEWLNARAGKRLRDLICQIQRIC